MEGKNRLLRINVKCAKNIVTLDNTLGDKIIDDGTGCYAVSVSSTSIAETTSKARLLKCIGTR